MHRFTLRFTVAILTFAIGVLASSIWVFYRLYSTDKTVGIHVKQPSAKKFDVPLNVPTVEFCDLIANPEYYNQKTVRVQAILTANSYVRIFSDIERCLTADPMVGFDFDPSFYNELNDPLQKQLFELVRPDGGTLTGSVNVTVIGRFEGLYFLRDKSSRYQHKLSIMHVEKIDSVLPNANISSSRKNE